MPDGFVAFYIKYAKDEKTALSYIIKAKPDATGIVVFKRGGSGKLISIERE